MNLRAFLFFLAVVLATSCASTRETAPMATTSSSVAELARRRHFTFWPSSDGFVGGHTTFAAAVGHDGAIRFRPRWADRKRRPPGEPSIALATRAIERGGPLLAAPKRALAEPDGSVVLERGAAVERLRNDDEGLEQTWSFATRPAGSGDLVVRVGVDTRARMAIDGDGVRFVDEASGHAVRYGKVQWVDASGARLPLPVRLVGTELVIRVPAEVVDGAAYPAVLDPTIGPELPVDDPVVGPAGFYTYSPIAAGGKNGAFLLAWIDERVLSLDSNLVFGQQQVYGARVSAAGALLDPTDIVIAGTRDFDIDSPAIAFDGQNWLVAWHEYPYNGPCTQVQAARVSDTGVVLDPLDIHIACLNAGYDLGFDGKNYLFTFVGPSAKLAGKNAQYATYVTTAGAVVNATPQALVEDVGGGLGRLACDRTTSCVFVQGSANGLRARRLDQAGVVGAPVAISSSSGDSLLGVDFDGTNYVFGWLDATGTRAARVVPATLAVLDQPGVLVSTNRAQGFASLATSSLFVWPTSGQLAGARFSSAGAALDAAPLPLTSAGSLTTFGDVAAAGTQFLVTWADARGGPGSRSLFAARVSAAGAPLDGDGFHVRLAANGQVRAAIAGDATGHLVAWEDERAGDYTSGVRVARLDANRASLDPTDIPIVAKGANPSVAYDGTQYLVAWVDTPYSMSYGAIKAVLVSKAGVVSAPMTLGSGSMSRAVFDGTNFVVAFLTNGPSIVRVTPAGTVLDATPINVGSRSTGFGGGLGLASNGQDIFVAWNGFAKDTAMLGVRVSKAGAVLDAKEIVLRDAPYDIYFPDAGWDGRNYVAVWEDFRTTHYTDADVYLGRVSPAGKALDPGGIPIATGPSHQAYPTVTSVGDGITAFVAWSDNRRTDRYQDFDIYGTFVRTTDGAVLDPNGIPVAAQVGNEVMPALAPSGPGNVVLAYHHVDPAAGFGAERVRTRLVTSGKLPATACASDADCASRACADGVCCDRPCNGTCETCAATPGTCTAVVNAEDADSCTADRTCDATGACRIKPGRSCTVTADCATGSCARGICCDTACDGPCETCTATPGTCTVRGARDPGSCAPFACDGTSRACPTRCASDAACPSGARCDVTSGACISGAYCLDAVTLAGAGTDTTSCAPYTCEAAACRTTCRDVHDCVYPAVCNESGACVAAEAPSEALGGCATSPRGSQKGGAALLLLALALLRARSGTRSRG